MPDFEVQVIIENRPQISDPEGQTILRDLIGRSFKSVSAVRTARMLKLTVNAATKEEAQKRTGEICDKLRIYNPLVSKVRISAAGLD